VTSDDPRYGSEVTRRMAALSGAGRGRRQRYRDGRAATGGRRGVAPAVLGVAAGRVVEARFQAFGCPHFLRRRPWLIRSLRDAGPADLEPGTGGRPPPRSKVPPPNTGACSHLQDAVRAAARNWAGRDPVLPCRIRAVSRSSQTTMTVSLTQSAAERVRSFLQSRARCRAAPRRQKTGCSGFAYVVNYADEVGAADVVFEDRGVRVIVDATACATWTARKSTSWPGLNEASKFRNPNVRASVVAARASTSNCPSRLNFIGRCRFGSILTRSIFEVGPARTRAGAGLEYWGLRFTSTGPSPRREDPHGRRTHPVHRQARWCPQESHWRGLPPLRAVGPEDRRRRG